MAYIVGLLTKEEEQELARRGWDVEPAPTELIDPDDEEIRDRMKMVWVDTNMFDVMNGADWEGTKPHVAVLGNFAEGFRIVGPYTSFDKAAAAHPGPDVWISTLERAIKMQRAYDPIGGGGGSGRSDLPYGQGGGGD